MARDVEARLADVRRLLDAARRVHQARASLIPELVERTGLTAEGVELGFGSLEREASELELRRLVEAAGAANHVHVVLSANVFVAPVRALALARAAGARVTVRPSPRDPVLAHALVAALRDPRVTLTSDRDVRATGADAVHVYGRDETVAHVRAQVGPAVTVTGHGAGLGVALVTAHAADDAAAKLARDVVAFDQRGCLSPRIVLVEGDDARAERFVDDVHAELTELDARVPRGRLSASEIDDAVRWADTVAFAGELRATASHAVGFVRGHALIVPPSGRHLQVLAVRQIADARSVLAPMARQIVTVGSDDAVAAASLGLAHARPSALGRMQRPPLDGPVDRRTTLAVT